MSDIAIEVNGVWKKFHLGETHDSLRDFIPAVARRVVGRGPKRSELSAGDFWSLKDVSFSLRRGDALGIIGLNGAGKSTLLKILSRVLRPNRGRYRVRGRLRALIEIAAGFHMDLTGRENIYLNGSILGMRKREIDAKLDQIVDFSGVEEFLDTPVKRYSSGMLARLGFAVAAHMDPEVLLIDEVLSVGDATFRNKCVEHMRSLVRSGVAVVFISHNLDQVVDLCREAIVLSQGQAVYAGHAGAAVSHYLDLCARMRGTSWASEVGQVLECTLQGAEGESFSPSQGVSPGTPLVIRAVVEIHRPASEFMAVVYLRDLQNDRIVGNYQWPFDRVGLDRPIRVDCLVRMHCSQGRYCLEFGLYHRPSDLRIAVQLPTVSVEERASTGGPVWLAPRFSLHAGARQSEREPQVQET